MKRSLMTCALLCLSLTAQGQALNLLLSESEGVQLGDLSPAKAGDHVVVERLVGNESQAWLYDLEAQQWHDLGVNNPVTIMPLNGQAAILHESNDLISLSVVDADSTQANTLYTTADDYLLGEHGVYLFNGDNEVARYVVNGFHEVNESTINLTAVRRESGVCDWANGDRVSVGKPFVPTQASPIYPIHVTSGPQSFSYDVMNQYGLFFSNLLLRKRGDFCLMFWIHPTPPVWDPNFYEQEFVFFDVASPSVSTAGAQSALGFDSEDWEDTIHDVLAVDGFFYGATKNKIYKIDTNTWERVAEAEVPLPSGPGHFAANDYAAPWDDNINQRAVLAKSGDVITLNNGFFTAKFDINLNPVGTPQWSPHGKTITQTSDLLAMNEEQTAFMLAEASGVDTSLYHQYPSLDPSVKTAGIGLWDEGELKLFYGDSRLAFGPNKRFRQQGQSRLVQATDRYTGRKGIYQLANKPVIGQFISGAWYDPELANQGLAIHQGKRTDGSDYLFLTAYLFKDGAPLWLAGVGEIPAYNAESITFDLFEFDGLNFLQPNQAANQTTFGSIELRLSDCNTLDIELDDGSTSHALSMYRGNDTTYRELCQ